MASTRTAQRRARARRGQRDYDLCRCGQQKQSKSRACARCRVHRPNSGSFSHGGPRVGGSPRAPIGTERVDKRSGETQVKVADGNPHSRVHPNGGLWVSRRVLNWVGAYGPVPDGLVVKRLSADQFDDAPENLALVSRRVMVLLCSGHWTSPRLPWSALPPDRETRLAAVAAAVALALAGELQEQGREAGA